MSTFNNDNDNDTDNDDDDDDNINNNIDIAVPADQKITRTEEEKFEKYQELAFEIRRIHGASKVTITPIVIGALGSMSKGAKTWFGKLGVPDFLERVQLSVILGTTHLLRKVLCF